MTITSSPATARLTCGNLRARNIRYMTVRCRDDVCGHWSRISFDRFGDATQLADIEARLVCHRCGAHGSELTPDFPKIAAAVD